MEGKWFRQVSVLAVVLGLFGCGGGSDDSGGLHDDTATTAIAVGGSVKAKAGGTVDGVFFVQNQNGDAVEVSDTEVRIDESTDGVNWQPVTFSFANGKQAEPTRKDPLGIATAITMDYSTTMLESGSIAPLEASVASFIDFMRSDSDAAEIIKFADDVHVIVPFTFSKEALYAAANNNYPIGGWTSLFDSMMTAINDTFAFEFEGTKAVIAMTDGQNNDSKATKNDVINNALSNSIPVITIGLGGDTPNEINESVLRSIADETHGFYYRAPTREDLMDVYLRISNTLKQSFKCTWAPTASGTVQCRVTITYRTVSGTFATESVFAYTH